MPHQPQIRSGPLEVSLAILAGQRTPGAQGSGRSHCEIHKMPPWDSLSNASSSLSLSIFCCVKSEVPLSVHFGALLHHRTESFPPAKV